MPKIRLGHFLAAASILFAFLLVVCWAATAWWLPALAVKQLAAYGITVQAIDIKRLGLRESKIGHMQIQDEDKGIQARAEDIRVGYRLTQLWNGRIDYLVIGHADLAIHPAAARPSANATAFRSPAEILDKIPLDHFEIKRLDLGIPGSDNVAMRKFSGMAELDKHRFHFHLGESQTDRPLNASAALDDSGSIVVDIQREGKRLLSLNSILNKAGEQYLIRGSMNADLEKLSEEAATWPGTGIPRVTGELKTEWHGFLPGNVTLSPEAIRSAFKGTSSLALDATTRHGTSAGTGAKLNLRLDYENGRGRWNFKDKSYLSFQTGRSHNKLELNGFGGNFRIQPGQVLLEIAQGAALKSDMLVLEEGEISNVTARLLQPMELDITPGRAWHQVNASTLFVQAGKSGMSGFGLAGAQATLHLNSMGTDLLAGVIAAKFTLPSGKALRLPDCRLASDFKLAHGLLNTQGSISVGEDKLHLDWSASHQLSNSSGHANYSLRPARLGRPGLDVGAILVQKSLPGISNGEISGAGKASWQRLHKTGGLRLQHEEEVVLKSLAGKYQSYSFSGLSGHFRMAGTDKNLSLSWNDLAVGAVNAGVPLRNLSVQGHIQLPGDGTLKMNLENLNGDVLGGKVSAPQIDIDLARAHNPFLIELRQLEASQLVELQNQEGLYADGILDGSLPVDWTANGIYISNGVLKARPPGGLIRYQGTQTVRNMAANNQAVKMALDILSDFHYHLLQIDINAEADGNTNLGIHLKGRNPAYENGRPIEFNLNVEQNLLKLLQSLSMANRISERLEQKIQKRIGD